MGVQCDTLVGVRLADGESSEGASFTVTGLNPQDTRVLFFQHRGKKLGKVVTVRGNAAQPVTVKLEPCGSVKGRLVDERGNPVPGVRVCLSEDASPGNAGAQTDNLGRFQLELFPGQKYSWGFPYGLWTHRDRASGIGSKQRSRRAGADLGKGPVRLCGQATSSPAGQRPGARSARPRRMLWHYNADRTCLGDPDYVVPIVSAVVGRVCAQPAFPSPPKASTPTAHSAPGRS
jgi:Carboxypeptidase regulatory-like domain